MKRSGPELPPAQPTIPLLMIGPWQPQFGSCLGQARFPSGGTPAGQPPLTTRGGAAPLPPQLIRPCTRKSFSERYSSPPHWLVAANRMNSTLGAECSGSSRSRNVCSLPPLPACSFRLMTDGEATATTAASAAAATGCGEGGGDEETEAAISGCWAGTTIASAAALWTTRGGGVGGGCVRWVAQRIKTMMTVEIRAVTLSVERFERRAPPALAGGRRS
mmetsp:Transcript_1310/g.2933  ORF Transcript_1310/g.2933 Transcript_1310/m.2933 type:complete len:218 (-) Transcript_1310:52-705(-)